MRPNSGRCKRIPYNVTAQAHGTRHQDKSTTTGEITVRVLSLSHPNLTSQEHQALQRLSFRTDGIAIAAPARTARRPTDACNRVIVEFRCGAVNLVKTERHHKAVAQFE